MSPNVCCTCLPLSSMAPLHMHWQLQMGFPIKSSRNTRLCVGARCGCDTPGRARDLLDHGLACIQSCYAMIGWKVMERMWMAPSKALWCLKQYGTGSHLLCTRFVQWPPSGLLGMLVTISAVHMHAWLGGSTGAFLKVRLTYGRPSTSSRAGCRSCSSCAKVLGASTEVCWDEFDCNAAVVVVIGEESFWARGPGLSQWGRSPVWWSFPPMPTHCVSCSPKV